MRYLTACVSVGYDLKCRQSMLWHNLGWIILYLLEIIKGTDSTISQWTARPRTGLHKNPCRRQQMFPLKIRRQLAFS